MFLDDHPARSPDHPHARRCTAGGRSHAGPGAKFRDLPTVDVLALTGQARRRREPPDLVGRPHTASCDHLLHERNHRDAQGRRVPACRLREPGPELRRLLRSHSGHGRDIANVVAGLRRQHLGDVQCLGVGLRRGHADQGANSVRPGPHSPSSVKPRSQCCSVRRYCSRPSLEHRRSISPIRCAATSCRRVKPSLVRSSSPGHGPTADHQYLWPHRGKHRHEPPELATGRPHHHRSAFPQCHLRHP